MLPERIEYLLTVLIANKMTSEEFSEFLTGLHDAEIESKYDEYLERYFERILFEEINSTKDILQKK